jgi:hypothetical protein
MNAQTSSSTWITKILLKIIYLWLFWFLPLQKFCSVQLSTFFIGSLILDELGFWAPCIFWLAVVCLMYSQWIFSHFVGGLFSVETISFVFFLISYSPVFPSFLFVPGLLEFYWGIVCPYLLFPENSLFFPVLTSEFQAWYSGPYSTLSWC